MARYRVLLAYTCYATVEVEAESEEKAKLVAKAAYIDIDPDQWENHSLDVEEVEESKE